VVAQLREHQLGGYAGGHVSDHQAVVPCSIGERDGLRSRPGGRPSRSRGIGLACGWDHERRSRGRGVWSLSVP